MVIRKAILCHDVIIYVIIYTSSNMSDYHRDYMVAYGRKQDAILHQQQLTMDALIYLDEQVGHDLEYLELGSAQQAAQHLRDHFWRVITDANTGMMDARRNTNVSTLSFVPETLVKDRYQRHQCTDKHVDNYVDGIVDPLFDNLQELIVANSSEEFIDIYNSYDYKGFEGALRQYFVDVGVCFMEYRNVLSGIKTWRATQNLTMDVPKMKRFSFEYEIHVSSAFNSKYMIGACAIDAFALDIHTRL